MRRLRRPRPDAPSGRELVRAHPPRVGHHLQLQGPGRKPPFEDRHADRSVDRQCRRHAVGDGVRRTGQLKHSVGEDVLGSTSGNTQQMYLAWAHARCTAATWDAVKNAWLPAYGNTKGAVCRRDGAGVVEKYRCGQYRYGRLLLDSLEPLDERLLRGQISLQFTASSNTAGPMYFQMEWAGYGQCQKPGRRSATNTWLRTGTTASQRPNTSSCCPTS